MSQRRHALRARVEQLRRRMDSGDPLRATDLETLLSGIEADAVALDYHNEDAERRLRLMSQHLDLLDERVLRLENSRAFQYLQRAGMALFGWTSRFRRGVARTSFRLEPQYDQRAYERWMEREERGQPSTEERKRQASGWECQPCFSILMPLENPDRAALDAALRSLARQSYTRWELCVCDDCSADLSIGTRLGEWEQAGRLRYVRSEARMGEASSLNRAAMLASGEYVVVMDSGQSLAPHALWCFAEALQERRYSILYSDEDRINEEGRRASPLFKPDWSPDLLTSSMYFGRFLAIERETLDDIGGFSPELEGGHLYDAALRITERSGAVKHVSRILIHSGASCAAEDRETRLKALDEACIRRGWEARTETAAEGAFRVRRKIEGTPLASIIICSRTPHLLENCLRMIDEKTAYPVRETIVVQHMTGHDEAMNHLLAHTRCVRVPHIGSFDFAAMNNAGARASSGQILVFLNDDIEPMEPGWLNDLLAEAQRATVGAVGAKLLYPNGAIQHAGIALGLVDGTGHPGRGTLGSPIWPWADQKRNVSAVTGACMAVRRSVFEELGGFDRRFPVNYNDTDFCLRGRARGYEVIYEPAAALRHYESSTRDRGVSWLERERWHERWHELLEHGDPYYSKHLTRTREDCALDEG